MTIVLLLKYEQHIRSIRCFQLELYEYCRQISFYNDGTHLFTECFIGCRKPTTVNRQFRYSHEFDHFILNAAATELVIQEPDRYTSDTDSSGTIRYGNKSMTLEYFLTHLSDHVPIFMSFDF